MAEEAKSPPTSDGQNSVRSNDSALAESATASGSADQSAAEGAAVSFLQRVQISEPLPSASEPRAYQAVDANLPGEILKDTAIRRDHRHSMEDHAARTYAAQVRMGQILAFLLAVVGFAAAIYARYLTGSTVLVISIAALGVGAPITVALRGHGKESPEK